MTTTIKIGRTPMQTELMFEGINLLHVLKVRSLEITPITADMNQPCSVLLELMPDSIEIEADDPHIMINDVRYKLVREED
jgi:hypothetical protein